jgi:hypothetical protein
LKVVHVLGSSTGYEAGMRSLLQKLAWKLSTWESKLEKAMTLDSQVHDAFDFA